MVLKRRGGAQRGKTLRGFSADDTLEVEVELGVTACSSNTSFFHVKKTIT